MLFRKYAQYIKVELTDSRTPINSEMCIGRDGFTNCNYVCKPSSSMQSSCERYCRDCVFTTSASQTDGSVTSPVIIPRAIEASKDHSVVVVLVCIAVVVIAMIIIFFCCFKKHISPIIQRFICPKRPGRPIQVEGGTDDVTSALVENGDNISLKNLSSRNSTDSGHVSASSESSHLIDEVGQSGHTATAGGNRTKGVRGNEQKYEDENTERKTVDVTNNFRSEGKPDPVKKVVHLAIGQRFSSRDIVALVDSGV